MSEHELWNELGNLYFLFGTYDQAIHAYNKAIALVPEAGEPYSNLALTYVQMGKYVEASETYQRGIHLLKDELDKAVSMHKLGDVFLHLKQFPQAAETYQKTEELVPDLGQIVETSKPADLLLHCQPSTVSSQLNQAGAACEASPLPSMGTAAPALFEELTPWWFEGQIEPGEEPEPDYDFMYIEDTATNENVIFTEPLVWELEKSSHTALMGQEVQAVNAMEMDEAAVVNDLELDHSVTPDVMNLSMVREADGTVSEHRAVSVDTAETAPNPVSIMIVIDDAEVVTEIPEFTTQNTTNAEAVQYESPVEWPVVELSEQERLDIQANITKYKRVLELNPRNAFAWDTLGGYYKALGQYDDAISSYQKAVSLDSSKAFYFHHLGLVYAAVGRHDDAIDVYERVIQVDPNHCLAHATLGGYYRKNDNEELAKAHIEKARSLLAPDENEYNRACMEAICGNTDRSLELLDIALKSKQSYVNWARKDPDLDFIRSDPRFHALLTEYAAKPVQ